MLRLALWPYWVARRRGKFLPVADDVGKAVADKGGFLYEITPNTQGAVPFYLFGVIHYDKISLPKSFTS